MNFVVAGFMLAIVGSTSTAVLAQSTVQPLPQIEPRPQLELRRIQLPERVLTLPDNETSSNVIDFENVQGRPSGVGIALSNQYEKTHGVSFGRGASVHVCARVFDDVNVSLCPYPQAASGNRVAVHEVRAGGATMEMSFSRPVQAVSMRINPTGGNLDEAFVAELTGFDAAGKQLVHENIEFKWYQDAFSWPTVAGFETDEARLSRVTVVLHRVARANAPVRFLFDDLTLIYSPEETLSPVAVALDAEQAPPKSPGRIVQSPEIGNAQSGLQLYPAATRRRAEIDWDAVDVTLAQQDAQNLKSPNFKGAKFVNAAELPVLLPSTVDAGSLLVVGNRDSYNAYFSVDGRAHSLYGSRMLTLMKAASGATADTTNLTLIRSRESMIGSFALYGASYALTRHCIDDSAEDDPACYDKDALGEVAAGMVVVVGEAGKGRP